MNPEAMPVVDFAEDSQAAMPGSSQPELWFARSQP